MILLDSLYINVSGGKVLLDYLVKNIENNNINCFYLFDERCRGDYKFVPNERKVFLEGSLIKRHRFYVDNKSKFYKVFCFGNLPPTVRMKVPVITYFHQLKFLDVPKSVSIFNKLKIDLKTFILSSINSNTNIWLVQSEIIKRRLAAKYRIDTEDIQIMPFYPPIKSSKMDYKRRKDGFVYISNGGDHKNHFNLIEAFCLYFDETQKGVLHITINENFPELLKLISNKKEEGYPIVNHGFIDRDELLEIYQSNAYLVYPSLAESFGLGLVEAIENGCNVIGADLPYTYAVCNPSLTFDPFDVNDIKRALVVSQQDNVKQTEQLLFNQIDELIGLIKE